MSVNSKKMTFKSKIDNYTIFKRLEVFIKIVECNSLSIAAQKLSLAPSSVSRTLAKLEEQLGVILIKRTTRHIVLTDAGQYLYLRAQNLLINLNESLTNTASFYEHPQGELKITCSIAFGTCHLMKLFSEYRMITPDVSLSVDLNDHLVNLNEENFDIALRITQNPPLNFAMRKISEIHWLYCASPHYLTLKGTPKNIEELIHYDCLVNPNVSHAWVIKDSLGNNVPLRITPLIQANSSLALLQAALNHQGIVCLPTYILGDYLQSKALIPILLNHHNESIYHLYALYCPSKYNDPKIRSFIDFLMIKFQDYAPWGEWINHNQNAQTQCFDKTKS